MLTEVFADTFFFPALINRQDPAHELARAQLNGRPDSVSGECQTLHC
jgi:predicted nucleic acid-binding protein